MASTITINATTRITPNTTPTIIAAEITFDGEEVCAAELTGVLLKDVEFMDVVVGRVDANVGTMK